MRTSRLLAGAALATATLTTGATLVDAAPKQVELSKLASFDSGVGEAGSEIVAFDHASARMFITNGALVALDIVDVSDPSSPSLVARVDLTAHGESIQSVAADRGRVFVAVAGAPGTRGTVEQFDVDGVHEHTYEAGYLPDGLTVSPSGRYVVVANEGEPVCDGDDLDVDPEGSVTVIDTVREKSREAGFRFLIGDEDALRADDVRIFFPGSNAAQDLEPEYVAIDHNSRTAYVTLQENNAIAVVDLHSASVTDVLPLGYKDHGVDGNGLDPSDRDDAELVQTWDVLGMYMPDAIDYHRIGGQEYLFTANEGDARDYDCFSEETRVKDLEDDFGLTLDVPPYAETDLDDEDLGRLKTTGAFPTDADGDGGVEQVYAYGARSFSIWDTEGNLVFDSGDDFEQLLKGTPFFNLDEDETDARSDDKGAEPEAIAVGRFKGRDLAFVGLERSGGIMVYDVSDPTAPVHVQYLNTGDDISPEGLLFVPQGKSPTGKPLLLAAHEVSGTTAVFELDLVTP